jgi:hypothetical protein
MKRNIDLASFIPGARQPQPGTRAYSESGRRDLVTVLFKDGTHGRFQRHIYSGGCIAGQPTAYVYRDGAMVWIKPGESVAWIES